MDLLTDLLPVLGLSMCLLTAPVSQNPRWIYGPAKEATETVFLYTAILLAALICSSLTRFLFLLTRKYWNDSEGDLRDSKTHFVSQVFQVFAVHLGATYGGSWWVRLNALRRCIYRYYPLYEQSNCVSEPKWILKVQRRLLRGTNTVSGDGHPPFWIFSSYVEFVRQLPAVVFTLLLLVVAILVISMMFKGSGVTGRSISGGNQVDSPPVECPSSSADQPQSDSIDRPSLETKKNSPSSGNSEKRALETLFVDASKNIKQAPIIKTEFLYKRDATVPGTPSSKKCDECGQCQESGEVCKKSEDREERPIEVEKNETEEGSGEGSLLSATVVSELDKFLEDETQNKTSSEGHTQKPPSPERVLEIKSNSGEACVIPQLSESVVKELDQFLAESQTGKPPGETTRKLKSPERVLETEDNPGEACVPPPLPESVVRELDQFLAEHQNEKAPAETTRKPKSPPTTVRRMSERIRNKVRKSVETTSCVEKPSSSETASTSKTPIATEAEASGGHRSSRRSTGGDAAEEVTPKKTGKAKGRGK